MADDWQDLPSNTQSSSGDWVDLPNTQSSPSAPTVPDRVGNDLLLQNTQKQPGLWEGIKRGFLQRGVGLGQDLNDVGVGDKLGLPDNQAYADYAKQLEKEGKGTGFVGTMGEMAGDPLSYTPLGETGAGIKGVVGLAGKLAGVGAVSGATGASTDPNDNLEKRAADALQSGAYSAALGPLAHVAGKGVGSAVQMAANKTGISDLLDKGLTEYGNSLSNQYGTGQIANSTGTDIYELAQKVGFPTNGKTPEEIYSGLQDWFKKSGSNISDQINPQATAAQNSYVRGTPSVDDTEFNPNDINTSISQNYHADKSDVNDLYNQARFHGEGKTTDANDLQSQLTSTVGELARKQFRSPSEERTLGKLQDIQQNLGWAPKPYRVNMETGETMPATASQATANTPSQAIVQPINKIGYNDLVDLKQALNEGYYDGAFKQKGDRPIASLFKNVKNTIDTAAEEDKDPQTGTSPFGDSLYNADGGYQDLANTYHNNSISKFWKPEDYYDYASGKVPDIDTQQRASKVLDNIKSPTDFSTIAQTLPKDAVDNLRAAKINQVIDDSGMNADSLQKNDKLVRSLIGNNTPAMQSYNNLLSGVQELNKRGITDRMYDLARENPDALPAATKAAMYMYFQKPHYAIKEGLKALISGQGAAYQRRLTGLTGDITSGAPSQSLLDPLTNFTASQVGKQAAIGVGDLSDNTRAEGGRVYAPDEWLTLIRRHGKKTGVKASDRLKPQAVEKIERASRNG